MQRIRVNNWSISVKGDSVEFWHIGEDRIPMFVARYFVDTIIEHGGRELQVDAGVPLWTARDYEMVAIVGWLKGITK